MAGITGTFAAVALVAASSVLAAPAHAPARSRHATAHTQASIPRSVRLAKRPKCLTGSASVTRKPAAPEWAPQALGLSSVWSHSRGGNVTVAVVDSGVDYTAPLAGHVSAAVDVTGTGTTDCAGHGTEVASLILDAAPAARIVSVKVTNAKNGSSPGNLARGIIDAAHYARVINVSVVTVSDSAALRNAVDYALSRGCVIVAAAGNTGTPGVPRNAPLYPASYPGVLSVGAEASDGSLSGTHTASPVDVTAPGASIVVPWAGGGYETVSGTSFATAFVSGVAALVLAHRTFPRTGAGAADVVQRIESTADGGYGPGTGHGLVNPVLAVTGLLAPAGPARIRPGAPVTVARAPVPDVAARDSALAIACGALAAALLALIGVVVADRGRRRHWRAGPAPDAGGARPTRMSPADGGGMDAGIVGGARSRP